MNVYKNALAQLDAAAELMDLDPAIRERLAHPDRVVEVAVPVTMDDGRLKVFKGYRVQHANARGPYKGGLRFHPKVDQNEVKALAFWMSMKCAAVGIPMGGGKGGVTVDPKKLSPAELERLTRAFTRQMKDVFGPDRDVPAPDVNTNAQIMSWIMDEYSAIQGKPQPAVVTGKPLALGGSQGRDTATADGGVIVFKELARKLKLKPKNTTVVVQGFGNAGYHAARLLHEAGYRIIGLSDSRGGIIDLRGKGMDPDHVMARKREHGMIGNMYCVGSVCDGANYKGVTNEKLLETKCDVLVPAALENQITEKNAGRIKAKVVLELANGPTTPAADEKLKRKKVIVVPDILANAGGVTVSYFEWVQNRSGERWSADKVTRKLTPIMVDAFNDIWQRAEEYNTTLRTAGFITALERLEAALTPRR